MARRQRDRPPVHHTVLVKGVDGAFGVIGGAILAFIKPSTIDHIVVVLTTHELSRNPNDFFSTRLVEWSSHLDVSKLAFAAGYLIAHGALKSFLAVTLLIGRPWSYPVGSAFLALFMAYRLIKRSQSAPPEPSAGG